ncbi:MAG TPA: hypothetical protein VJR89_32380 [Polyangiales bacterium]|nr:hypothetical protein [Polyangiales bacterium]
MAARKSSRRPPWKRANPRKTTKTLNSTEKRAAKRRARKAGRPYPNLVDNMAVAKRKKRGAAPKRKRKP